MRRRILLIGLVAVAAVAAGLIASSGGVMINDVTTGRTLAYPDLQPQRFDTDQEVVFEAAVETLTSLGIEITAQERATGRIQGVATTRIFSFKDDGTITLSRVGEATIVNIRSASSVGMSCRQRAHAPLQRDSPRHHSRRRR